MKRYDEYKQTGTPWIGEIPSHWEVKRIKHISKVFGRIGFRGYTNSDIVNEGEGAITLSPSNIIDGRMDYSKCSYLSWDKYYESPEIMICNGDVLFVKTASVGKTALVENLPMEATINPQIVVIKEIHSNNRYLAYLMGTNVIDSQMRVKLGGSTIYTITQHSIENYQIPIPPLSEQEAIAAYLDKKCGSIDAVISTQERRIALLEELKQSVITEAVTHGINPDAKLRPSGIDWIGNIPEHWQCRRLRFICEFRNGYTPSKANPDFWTDGTIPWYRMEDIRDSGRRLNEAKQYVTKEAVKGGGLFEAGSFILATTATIGEHAVLIVDSLANQQFTNLKIRKSLSEVVDNEFFFYYLFVIDEYCKSTTKTATFAAVNIDDLKNFAVTIPSYNEQLQIVEYIKHKTSSIDASIAKAKREIELLRELKQSVITEAVTGKIKIF